VTCHVGFPLMRDLINLEHAWEHYGRLAMREIRRYDAPIGRKYRPEGWQYAESPGSGWDYAWRSYMKSYVVGPNKAKFCFADEDVLLDVLVFQLLVVVRG
jgi:hypothetical protein